MRTPTRRSGRQPGVRCPGDPRAYDPASNQPLYIGVTLTRAQVAWLEAHARQRGTKVGTLVTGLINELDESQPPWAAEGKDELLAVTAAEFAADRAAGRRRRRWSFYFPARTASKVVATAEAVGINSSEVVRAVVRHAMYGERRGRTKPEPENLQQLRLPMQTSQLRSAS